MAETQPGEAGDAESRGLLEYPGAPLWLVYPWEESFADTCKDLPPWVEDILRNEGTDEDNRQVLKLQLTPSGFGEAEPLAQQALCVLDRLAQNIGWTRPMHEGKMKMMRVSVDCSKMSSLNWMPCVRCIVQVISAIKPFVSPFYDRLPGLIDIVDPPAVLSSAWAFIKPLLGKPTREVVRFVYSSESVGEPQESADEAELM